MFKTIFVIVVLFGLTGNCFSAVGDGRSKSLYLVSGIEKEDKENVNIIKENCQRGSRYVQNLYPGSTLECFPLQGILKVGNKSYSFSGGQMNEEEYISKDNLKHTYIYSPITGSVVEHKLTDGNNTIIISIPYGNSSAYKYKMAYLPILTETANMTGQDSKYLAMSTTRMADELNKLYDEIEEPIGSIIMYMANTIIRNPEYRESIVKLIIHSVKEQSANK